MSFEVSYLVPEWEWARAKRSRRNDNVEPTVHRFFGEVTIVADGAAFCKSGVINMSVADLAVGLAEVLDGGMGTPGHQGDAMFEQGGDALRIYFRSDGSRIEISGDGPLLRCLAVSADEFRRGVTRFVTSFAREANGRIPDVTDWKELVILKPYLGRQQ